jgi:tetratricopeptide (TPR) repeat protein
VHESGRFGCSRTCLWPGQITAMGTIAIIEGSLCGYQPPSGNRVVVRLPACAGRFVPHQLIRSALPVLRRAIAEPDFAAKVAPSRAALSVVFAGLRHGILDVESGIAESLSARLTSHLTHNIPMQELLWEEYARFLLASNAVAPFVILVEDLRRLDENSFALLLQLFRSGAEQAPDVVVGYTADLPERVAMDERGIVWDIGVVDLRRLLGALRRLPSRLEDASGATEPCSCPIVRDVWDLCPEQTIMQLVARASDGLSLTETASIAPAIRQIFSTFAFDAALALALAVLDAGLPISAGDRSAICGVAALSAHNRQFFSQGNQRIAGFLRDTYRDALAHESDPEHRISLYYRLAVTYCRRLGDIGSARQAIDTGLAELARAELPVLDRQLQEAWLRNIDALVHVRRGDLAAALSSCEQAFGALAGVVAPDHASAAEVELSRLVVGENALTLASMSGDEPSRDLWLARARDGLEIWPSLTVVNVLEQQRTHIDRLEIAEARDLGVTALDLARSKLSPLLEYFVLVSLSDLSFRLADHDAAAEYGDRARSLGAEIGDVNGTRLALELRAAEISDARGRLDEAEQALRDLIAAAPSSVDLRAEVWGRLACLYARRGDRERALELIEQSIELTADSGELDLLLRASCHAGDVAFLLGMYGDAGMAYSNCFELLGSPEVASTPAREILQLRAVLGQQRLGQPDLSQLAICVQRLPRLMAREREAWPLARELVRSPLVDRLASPEFETTVRVVSEALAVRDATAHPVVR